MAERVPVQRAGACRQPSHRARGPVGSRRDRATPGAHRRGLWRWRHPGPGRTGHRRVGSALPARRADAESASARELADRLMAAAAARLRPAPARTSRPLVMGMLMLWGAPRSRSTAFYRMMAERGDFTAVFEPFSHAAVFGQAEIGGRPLATVPEILAELRSLTATRQVFIKDTTDRRHPEVSRRPAVPGAGRSAHLPDPAPAGGHPLHPGRPAQSPAARDRVRGPVRGVHEGQEADRARSPGRGRRRPDGPAR